MGPGEATSWTRLAVYYVVIAGILWYQELRRTENAQLACATSRSVAATLVLMTFEMRAWEMAPLIPFALDTLDVRMTFYETPGSENRTSLLFSAGQESALVFKGNTFWISYAVEFLNPSDASFTCFKSSFETVSSQILAGGSS